MVGDSGDFEMNNEKKRLGCVDQKGHEIVSNQLCGDYFINPDIRIPSLKNQHSMGGKKGFFVAQMFQIYVLMVLYVELGGDINIFEVSKFLMVLPFCPNLGKNT